MELQPPITGPKEGSIQGEDIIIAAKMCIDCYANIKANQVAAAREAKDQREAEREGKIK